MITCSANAYELDLPASVTIYDHEYDLELFENFALLEKLQLENTPAADKHFQGKLNGYPDSWVRASFIGGRWKGIVSLSGQAYLIDSELLSSASPHLSETGDAIRLLADPVASHDPLDCGVVHLDQGLTKSAAHSALQSPTAIPYSSLCERTVSGICVLAEAEFAFDHAFQQSVPNNTESEALSLINMTEGVFQNSLKIAFDTISIRMQNIGELSATTNADALLSDLYKKREQGKLIGDANKKSLFHLVTGRDFDSDTVGIAYIDTLCSSAAVGTTQLMHKYNGDPDLQLTALIVAHEFGHNFGADHDVAENSCGSGYVMEPALQRNAREFSDCTRDDVKAVVSALPDLRSCFNFPVAYSYTAMSDNPSVVAAGQSVTLNYAINISAGHQAVQSFRASGGVAGDQGIFESVTLDGMPCSISNAGSSYSCPQNNPADGLVLSYTVRSIGLLPDFIVSNTLATTGSSDLELVPVAGTQKQLNTQISIVSVVPAAASDLSALFGDNTPGSGVSLSWTDNSNNEQGFLIERRQDGGAFLQIGSTTTPYYTDNSTSVENDRFEYRVIAFNATGAGAASNIAAATLSVPTAARFLRADFVSDSEVLLTWAGLYTNNEEGVRIERKIDAAGFIAIGSVGADVGEFRDVSLVYGSLHEYRAIAFNAAGDAAASNSVTLTPMLQPLAVNDLTLLQRPGTSHVDIYWVANSHNEDGFRIERRIPGGEFAAIGVVGTNAAEFVDLSSEANTSYEYRIFAFNEHGDAPSAAIANLAVVGIPAFPTAATAQQYSSVAVTIRWFDNSNNEDGFSILRSTNGADFVPIMATGPNTVDVYDEHVEANVEYRYKVVAFNLAGDSAPSNAASVNIANKKCGAATQCSNGGSGSADWYLLFIVALLVARRRKLQNCSN